MVEEMLVARRFGHLRETIWRWGLKFGREFANRIRGRTPSAVTNGTRTVVITIAGEKHWLWRAVDQERVLCQHYADLADRDANLRSIDLFSEAGRERLATMIEADVTAYGDPVLIALDTGTALIAAMHRKDSTQAWTYLSFALRWLSNRLRCCVCILLHAHKSGAAPRGPVGHLLANRDTEMKAVAREKCSSLTGPCVPHRPELTPSIRATTPPREAPSRRSLNVTVPDPLIGSITRFGRIRLPQCAGAADSG
jgi:hypothetical protein